MEIMKMSLEDAHEICKWEYEDPYSLYNSGDSSETIKEYMDGTYYAARNEAGDLIGFYCFGAATHRFLVGGKWVYIKKII